MMGELQIANLPIIIVSIIMICLGVLAYLEIKKLDSKYNLIINKLEEINTNCKKIDVRPIVNEPIKEQMQKNVQIRMPDINNVINKELIIEKDEEIDYQNQEMNQEDKVFIMEEVYYENYDNKDDNKIQEDIEIEDEEVDDVDEEVDEEVDDDVSETTEMTIELDNKYKHLSVRELKELCNENDLKVSGNKTTLINRLLSLENN